MRCFTWLCNNSQRSPACGVYVSTDSIREGIFCLSVFKLLSYQLLCLLYILILTTEYSYYLIKIEVSHQVWPVNRGCLPILGICFISEVRVWPALSFVLFTGYMRRLTIVVRFMYIKSECTIFKIPGGHFAGIQGTGKLESVASGR